MTDPNAGEPAADPWAASSQMMDAWMRSQRQLWDAWAQGATAHRPATPPPADPASAMVDAWTRMARQTTSAWTAGADPSARDAATRMLEAQEQSMRFAQAALGAWESAMRPAGDAASLSAAVEQWNAQMRAWLTGGAAPAMGADPAALWRQYLESLARMMGPFAQGASPFAGATPDASQGQRSELSELMRLNWDAFERSVGRVVEAPNLGSTREYDERLMRGFDTWLDYRRAVLDYQVVLGEAWADAIEAASRALLARAEGGDPVGSLRELGAVWTQATDEVLEAEFRSDRYAAAQGAMVDAAMRYRMAEREIVETFLAMTDIASRSEVDEALREIYLLRRELRTLRRELAELRGAGAPPADEHEHEHERKHEEGGNDA